MYSKNEHDDRTSINVTIQDFKVNQHTGEHFSIHVIKENNVLQIPIRGPVDRAIKWQIVSRIFRLENIDI